MSLLGCLFFFFFSSRRRHTRLQGDWSSDVCSSDLPRSPTGSELARSWCGSWILRGPRCESTARTGVSPSCTRTSCSTAKTSWRASPVRSRRCFPSATGPHPFPPRTRSLSLSATMVLPLRGGGRVGRRQRSTTNVQCPIPNDQFRNWVFDIGHWTFCLYGPLGPRVDIQRSLPPLPPGRFDVKISVRPSRDRLGCEST